MPRITPGGAFRRALAAAALVAAAPADALEPPYEATERGARCDLQADGSLGCRYVVGRDLEFELRRVGEPAVSLRLLRSSDAGDYRADARMMSDCVFVRHGAAGRAAGGADFVYAFVSGRNGRVYRQLSECRESR